jgi:hypothetical protein
MNLLDEHAMLNLMINKFFSLLKGCTQFGQLSNTSCGGFQAPTEIALIMSAERECR